MAAAFIPIVLALMVGVAFSVVTWALAFILLHHSMDREEERQAARWEAQKWTEEEVPAYPEAWNAPGDHRGWYSDQWQEGPGGDPDGIHYPHHGHMGPHRQQGPHAGDHWGGNA